MGLGRVGRVAHSMGLIGALPSASLHFSNSPKQPQVITVAGTNGKGSCVASLEQLLLERGFRVGAYTSPHFLHYCERIRVNGQPAPESDVCQAFAAIDAARGDTSLTYFEFGTLAGLEVFRQSEVDFVLLEVGLGGRLDAVNIVDADVAIITSIALDHEDWLGSDLAVIAAEKSGIARPDKPVISVVGDSSDAVVKACDRIGAQVYQLGRDFDVESQDGFWSLRSGSYAIANAVLPALPLPSVVAAILALRHFDIEFDDIELQRRLASLSLPGRYQQLAYNQRTLILDVAHNPAAAAFLAERLSHREEGGNTYALLAIMADKDIAGVVDSLCGVAQQWVVAPLPNNERAALPADVLPLLQERGLQASAGSSVEGALAYLLAQSVPGDTILVLGSFFTVAEVLALVEKECG